MEAARRAKFGEDEDMNLRKVPDADPFLDELGIQSGERAERERAGGGDGRCAW